MVDPGAFGKRLKLLGFATEPRDAKGKKLRLTEAVGARALQLALEISGFPRSRTVRQRRQSRAETKLMARQCRYVCSVGPI